MCWNGELKEQVIFQLTTTTMKNQFLLIVVACACLAISVSAKKSNDTQVKVKGSTYGFCNGMNFPSVSAGGQASLTCNGLDNIFPAGHILTCSPTTVPSAGLFQYYVTGFGELTIVYINTSGSSVDLSSTDFTCATFCPEC